MSIKNLIETIKSKGLFQAMGLLHQLYKTAIENEENLAESEVKCAALAAENAALKSAIEFAEPWLPSCDDELLHRIKMAMQTTATDAFIAEQRAFGVEMFAKNCDDSIGMIESEDEELYVLMEEQARLYAAPQQG